MTDLFRHFFSLVTLQEECAQENREMHLRILMETPERLPDTTAEIIKIKP